MTGGLVSLFRQGLAAHPDRIALSVGTSRLTYAEVEERAARTAAAVVGAARVGVLATTESAHIGVLAAMYAGAAAVPLNTNFPIARTAAAIAAAGVDTVVVDRRGAQLAENLPGLTVVPLGRTGRRLDQPVPVAPDDEAYVMFTSGSTGRPKGVPISHRNATHFMDVVRRRYPITMDDVVAQTFEPTFDLFMFAPFVAWSAGAEVITLSTRAMRDLPGFIARHRVSLWFSVPSTIRLAGKLGMLAPGSMPTLRRSLFCGEALSTMDARAWLQAAPNGVLDNLYGPTELTIACSHHRFDPDEDDPTVSIGRLHEGLRHVLADGDRKTDVEGELCVAGPQMFRGYLDPADDEGRFLRVDGTRWYRTGDRVRLLPGGTMAFLGRVDHQLKVKGYRVEALEVEHAVRQVDGIDECASVLIERNGEPMLAVAYVGTGALAGSLRRTLASRIPAYMVPDVVVHTETLPLNDNGKVDRAKVAALLTE